MASRWGCINQEASDGDAKIVSCRRHTHSRRGSAGQASAPAAHPTQSLSASLPVDARCLPAAQSTHAVADNGDAAYFPAPHVMQFVSPSDAVCLPVKWHINIKE